ncbi:MAG TPA: thioredoxin domain-containing protein [Terriglobales bacterium]|nr:thioredoxin domain-containing protein [Terriglobales bacterium]
MRPVVVSIVACLLAGILLAQNASPNKAGAQPASTLAASHVPSPLTRETVESFLHHMFGYDQNLRIEVVDIKPAPDPALYEVDARATTPQGQQGLKLYVTPDQKYALYADMMPFGADPFLAARETLKSQMNGPSRGPADAQVTIVEFGDLQCPACKRAQPTIQKLLSEVPNSRLVFQQFPLTQIHKWALTASKYAQCVAKQNNDAFWKYVDTVYDRQDEISRLNENEIEGRLKQLVGETGLSPDTVAACTADPGIAAQIYASQALGNALEVTATPTLFINGRKIANVGGTPYDVLKQITAFQAQSK